MKWLVVWFGLATAFAQSPGELGAVPPVEAPEPALPAPGPPPRPEDVDAISRAISLGLRCPVCQGLSVADSPSETAVSMKHRVRELVEQGYTEPQIVDYFVSRYGEWVLLAPPVRSNWLVWFGPGLVLGVGLAWVGATVLRWRKEPEALPSDVGLVPKDDYEQRLLREIDE